MTIRALKSRSAVVWGVIGSLLLVGLWALPAAVAQGEDERTDADSVPSDEAQGVVAVAEDVKRSWVDPITFFKIEELPLAAEPDFDFWTLNSSEIFEPGVANLSVDRTFDVSTETEHHLRALQAVATVENAISSVEGDIVAAVAGIDAANVDIRRATDEVAEIEDMIDEVQLEVDDVLRADDAEVDEQARLNGIIREVNGAVAELAVQAFTGESDLAHGESTDSAGASQLRVVTDELRQFQRADIVALQELIRESEERRQVLSEELAPVLAVQAVFEGEIDELEIRIEQLVDERTRLRFGIFDYEDRLVELAETLEDTQDFTEITAAQYQDVYNERLTAFVSGTDIPLVALNAYVRASRALASESPGCGIHWSQLAGIARIESIHGYFGDSTLDQDGNTTTDIIGIPLNGRNGTQLIRDSDDGALDGDLVYDRAVGPTQFIPTTWELYGSDGNDDGETDPQNIYDAALSSARYLCAAPGSMQTLEGEQAAYWAYNHDLEYSRNVTNAGRQYHDRFDVSPESSAFAAFAAQPTLEELEAIEEAERLAEEEAAAEAAENGETVDGEEADADGDQLDAALATNSSSGG